MPATIQYSHRSSLSSQIRTSSQLSESIGGTLYHGRPSKDVTPVTSDVESCGERSPKTFTEPSSKGFPNGRRETPAHDLRRALGITRRQSGRLQRFVSRAVASIIRLWRREPLGRRSAPAGACLLARLHFSVRCTAVRDLQVRDATDREIFMSAREADAVDRRRPRGPAWTRVRGQPTCCAA